MATIEHCIYCFETLSAHFEKRQSLTLSRIQQLSRQQDLVPPSTLGLQSAPRSDTSTPISNTSTSSTASSALASSSSLVSGPASSVTSASSLPSVGLEELDSPLFITWNARHKGGELRLRGCLGTFEAQPLEEGLSRYALISALEDHRFSPIPASTLPTLSVTVTLLTNFEPCTSPLGWDLGTHGIRIAFVHRGRRHSACFLPDVAVEQGWDKEETLVSAMHKGGWRGRDEDWETVASKGGLEVVRFMGERKDMGFQDWQAWRWSKGLKAT